VNGVDDALNHTPQNHQHDRHGNTGVHREGLWRHGVSNGVSSSDVTLTADNSALLPAADTGSNAASTLSTSDSNSPSTLSAGDANGAATSSVGDCVSSDGAFSGFIIAMHRKMVLSHFLSFFVSIFTFTLSRIVEQFFMCVCV